MLYYTRKHGQDDAAGVLRALMKTCHQLYLQVEAIRQHASQNIGKQSSSRETRRCTAQLQWLYTYLEQAVSDSKAHVPSRHRGTAVRVLKGHPYKKKRPTVPQMLNGNPQLMLNVADHKAALRSAIIAKGEWGVAKEGLGAGRWRGGFGGGGGIHVIIQLSNYKRALRHGTTRT